MCILFDIWLYNEKEIHEQVVLVSDNAVTGSVLNNFKLNVANLSGDGCTIDTMFLWQSSAYINSLLSESDSESMSGWRISIIALQSEDNSCG